ncbi:protein of unknown function [Paraburkholderia kururiensis]
MDEILPGASGCGRNFEQPTDFGRGRQMCHAQHRAAHRGLRQVQRKTHAAGGVQGGEAQRPGLVAAVADQRLAQRRGVLRVHGDVHHHVAARGWGATGVVGDRRFGCDRFAVAGRAADVGSRFADFQESHFQKSPKGAQGGQRVRHGGLVVLGGGLKTIREVGALSDPERSSSG